MKLFQREHTYQHPWERVSLAFWKKYPNPLSPQVLDVDIVDRGVDSQGKLTTERVLSIKGSLPSMLQRLVGGENCYVLETSEVDPKNKSMVMRSKNVSFSSIITVEETCTYTQHPENPEWTTYHQEAKISVSIPGLSSKAEGWSIANFQKNAMRGLEVMEELCQGIQLESFSPFASANNNS